MRVDSIKIKSEYQLAVAPLAEGDFDRLRDSIKNRGITEPVVINADNVLLDGHHRVKIAKQLGIDDIPVRVQKFSGDYAEFDEREYVLDANYARRQLTKDQQYVYALKLEEIASERSEAIMKAGGKVPAEGQARDIAAKKSGVSTKSIQKLKKFKKEAPDLADKIFNEGMAIKAADRELKARETAKKLESLQIAKKKVEDSLRAESAEAKFNSLKIDNQKEIDEVNARGAIKQSIEDEDGEMIVIGGDDDGNLKKGSMPSYMADADTIARIKSDIAVDQEIMKAVDDDLDVISTIGYSGKDIADFIQILLDNNIEVLVDVRDSPRSRVPDYNRDALKEHLEGFGIKYVGVPRVGACKFLREGFLGGHVEFSAFSAYYKYSMLDKIVDFAAQIKPLGRVALMCAEDSPAHCHRGILAKMLVERRFYARIKNL